MAGATPISAFTAHLHRRRHFSTNNRILRSPTFRVSSIAAPFPTKPTKRKNYLRPKILKTLKKPFIPKLPSTDPVTSIDIPTVEEEAKQPEETEFQKVDKPENQESIGSEETEIHRLEKFENQELKEAVVSGNSGVIVDDSIVEFNKHTFLKHGLWIVGAFVFHTVCAAWIFGSAENDSENQTVHKNETNWDAKNKSKVDHFLNVNGNGTPGFENGGLHIDEVEMKRKIEEIRAMAREARAKEKRESKKGSFESEEEDDMDEVKPIKSVIEKEVDKKLVNLKKKLEKKSSKKFPVSSVGISKTADERKNQDEMKRLRKKKEKAALMFEKKNNFKGSANSLEEKPKGFGNSENDSISKVKRNGNVEKGNDLLKSGNEDDDEGDSERSNLEQLEEDGERKGKLEVTESSNGTMKKSVKEKGTKEQGKNGVTKPNVRNGIVQDETHSTPVVESMDSRKSKPESVKTSESAPSNMRINGNNSLNKKEVGNQVANDVGDNNSESETDFWWLNLPYVLGIFMHSGHVDEGNQGLYSLKSTSNGRSGLSHTVAFEDRADASNFCYLLRSYFDGLKDFGAAVVPLKVADLSEKVKSRTMRLAVVRKGQLKLYAGQPLNDAEMALLTLLK